MSEGCFRRVTWSRCNDVPLQSLGRSAPSRLTSQSLVDHRGPARFPVDAGGLQDVVRGHVRQPREPCVLGGDQRVQVRSAAQTHQGRWLRSAARPQPETLRVVGIDSPGRAASAAARRRQPAVRRQAGGPPPCGHAREHPKAASPASRAVRAPGPRRWAVAGPTPTRSCSSRNQADDIVGLSG